MHRLIQRRLFFPLTLAALALAACGTVSSYVTGHISFPKQAVRAVFERMEKNPSVLEHVPPAAESPISSSTGHSPGLGPTAAPGCPKVPGWWPVGVACAQETRRPSLPPDPEQALLEELSRIPEARESLRSRQERDSFILKWKKTELIGEAKDGRVVYLKGRREVSRDILARVSNENDDRRILMRAMARAVVTINGVKPAEKLIKAQIPATQREFAAVRRRLSPPATWVQLPDGQWVKK